MELISYVGLDVHKRSIEVCAFDALSKEWRQWSGDNTPEGIKKLIKALRNLSGTVYTCYEAGPTGFGLCRKLREEGLACEVVAPTRVPVRPGDRVKTDRRDARKLCDLLRAGILTGIEIPDEAQESLRDFCRARDAARRLRQSARQQLLKFLDRRGLRYAGHNWTTRFEIFLNSLRFENPLDSETLEHLRTVVSQLDERIEHVDKRLAELARAEPQREIVARLRTLRGMDTWSAMVLATEIFRFDRFASAPALMAYVGLVPGESSSGERQNRLSITKAGNSRVRRILVEAAHHQRNPYRLTKALRQRREGQPAWVLEVANRAGTRLHRKYHRMAERRKPTNQVVTAVARELVGFIWALLNRELAQHQHLRPQARTRERRRGGRKPTGGSPAPMGRAQEATS